MGTSPAPAHRHRCVNQRSVHNSARSCRKTRYAPLAGRRRTRAAELGCGQARHGKLPRVSYDPSGFGSMRGVFLRCRRRALTAPAQETGACRTPLTVFLPYRPMAWSVLFHPYVSPCFSRNGHYPPNRCGSPIRWLRASANRVCHLRCVRRLTVRLRRSGAIF